MVFVLLAGISSGVVVGAGGLVLASAALGRAHGLKARARVVAMANMGDSPTLMLNAPVPATRKVLAKAGLTVDDIDLFEINEAFAVVAEKYIRDLKRGLVTMCAAGGMAPAIIIERV
jgi:acetyl-CoA C-acetyltransferase